jgi:hypothetical protein
LTGLQADSCTRVGRWAQVLAAKAWQQARERAPVQVIVSHDQAEATRVTVGGGPRHTVTGGLDEITWRVTAGGGLNRSAQHEKDVRLRGQHQLDAGCGFDQVD